jgi:alpha-amylase
MILRAVLIAFEKIIVTLITALFFSFSVYSQNDIMMQAFYWNVPVDGLNNNGIWWDNLKQQSKEFKDIGITAIWVPSPSKGNWGIYDMGYGIYDHYDLGNYFQKHTFETRFGSRLELEEMISSMHDTSNNESAIKVYADIILNHIYAADENSENNPVVRKYVFDHALRDGQQRTPYPTNEIKWVVNHLPAGDYIIKVKGYGLDFTAPYQTRGYDIEIDFNNSVFNSYFILEDEPNDGNGSYNHLPKSGYTIKAFINHKDDVDGYKFYKEENKSIIIRITARQEIGTEWRWADQTHGYYPFEVWFNGQNITASKVEAHTNTHIFYPFHTGQGEKNYSWNYTHFHPANDNDWLGNWENNDEIIPRTKGYGNDLDTYSDTVQKRMNDWGRWLVDRIKFDGFRLDFVRGFQESYAVSWIKNLPLINGKQRFVVGEYWGNKSSIYDWVTHTNALGAEVKAFDFPLKFVLTNMCNSDESFDMRILNNAGMIRNNEGFCLPDSLVVTFLENHDTGKEHDKWVTKDWQLGYAYLLTHQGRPCIFYPHLYGVDLVDYQSTSSVVKIPELLKEDIKKLIYIRKTYLGGILSVINPIGDQNTQNVYVARRQGNTKKEGAIVVINNSNSSRGLWVQATPDGWNSWSDKLLVNVYDNTITTMVSSVGEVWVEAPARGYSIYVLSSDYEEYCKD